MLTVRERETYDYVVKFITENEIAPTISEIAMGIGIRSKGVAHRYLQAVEQEGLITLIPNRKRNIVLNIKPKGDDSKLQIPLLGKIAAGQPIEAIHNQENLDLAATLAAEDRFVLKVSGDSMIDMGIFDGDYVICQHCQTAKNGQVVVALIDDEEATLKRFKRLNDRRIQLIPENSTMDPFEYHAERVRIQGIMQALIRTYNEWE